MALDKDQSGSILYSTISEFGYFVSGKLLVLLLLLSLLLYIVVVVFVFLLLLYSGASIPQTYRNTQICLFELLLSAK